MTVAFQWQFGSGVPPAAVVDPNESAVPATWTASPSAAADTAAADRSTMDERGHGGLEPTDLDRVARPVRRPTLSAAAGEGPARVGPAGPRGTLGGQRARRLNNLAGADRAGGLAVGFGAALVSVSAIAGKLDLALAGGGRVDRVPIACLLPSGNGN